MKIIQEIEKSRLSEENMNELVGGLLTPGDMCSEKVKFSSCSMKHEIVECFSKETCSFYYYDCTGPDNSQKNLCQPYLNILNIE